VVREQPLQHALGVVALLGHLDQLFALLDVDGHPNIVTDASPLAPANSSEAMSAWRCRSSSNSIASGASIERRNAGFVAKQQS
jgi:hypothetical protein